MRTIASTVGTREEAEVARRRLEALGIGPERITMRDIDDSAAQDSGTGGVFISVKVPPEHVAAATGILKGGESGRPDAGAAEPVQRRREEQPPAQPASSGGSVADPASAGAVANASEGFWVEEAAQASDTPAAPARTTMAQPSAAPAPRAQPAAQRGPDAPVIQSRVGPAKEGALAKRREESGGFSRLFVIAVMLAALGMALGAFLGTLV